MMSEKAVTISQQAFDDEDMAAVGRAFMEAIEQARQCDEYVKDWSPSQCPSEIIFDLLNRFDERPSYMEMIDLVAAIIRDEAKYDPVTKTWDVDRAATDIVNAFKNA